MLGIYLPSLLRAYSLRLRECCVVYLRLGHRRHQTGITGTIPAGLQVLFNRNSNKTLTSDVKVLQQRKREEISLDFTFLNTFKQMKREFHLKFILNLLLLHRGYKP